MTDDQLSLSLERKKTAPPPFVCVDPAGVGRPWNGVGRRPDYVKKALMETGMYPVAKVPEQVSREELEKRLADLVALLTRHVRETTKQLAALERRIEVLEGLARSEAGEMRRAA